MRIRPIQAGFSPPDIGIAEDLPVGQSKTSVFDEALLSATKAGKIVPVSRMGSTKKNNRVYERLAYLAEKLYYQP